ncbi:MAG: preprotein translocase subunit YajC [Immundisolibacteraceae bacterium]|nr:preprotein translocase subunit YajC [Immundisolibacteraceae bacterium]
MGFLVSDAMAAPQAAAATPGFDSFIFVGLLFVIFYFMIIRPQSKRQKEQREMVTALGKGDEVVTNGGLIGKVIKAGDTFLVLELAAGVEVNVQRNAIMQVLPKGTIKGL